MKMDRTKAGYVEGIISVVVNLVLFGLKFWAGVVTGSIALRADAWHTLSDSLSSIIVIVGVKLSSRKPDRKHPFGHGRWEQISAIFISFLLAIIAYDFMRDSIENLKEHHATKFGPIAIVVTIVSIVVKEALAQYAFYIARKTQNSSVRADGWHHRTDALSSLVVLIGILLAGRFWWVDGALGIIIALMLFWATFTIMKEAIGKLLGETPSADMIKKIEELVLKVHPQGLTPHHYHIHNYVHHQELTFHIYLEPGMDISLAHQIATKIENQILNELNITATIHMEPKGVVHPA